MGNDGVYTHLYLMNIQGWVKLTVPISWLIEHGYKKTPAAQRFARDIRDCGFEVRKSNGGLNYVFGIREGKQLYAEANFLKQTDSFK